MIDMSRVAHQLVRSEVDRTRSLDHGEGALAEFWAVLVQLILAELPPGTKPRISELVVSYLLLEDDDGA